MYLDCLDGLDCKICNKFPKTSRDTTQNAQTDPNFEAKNAPKYSNKKVPNVPSESLERRHLAMYLDCLDCVDWQHVQQVSQELQGTAQTPPNLVPKACQHIARKSA